MNNEPKWKTVLQPFAGQYATLIRDIDVYCRESDDDELTDFIEMTRQPSQTNCWWAIFAVALIARDQAEVELYRRTRARVSAGSGTPGGEK